MGVYIRVWRLLRQLRPDIVHTRNLASLECQLPAWLAGVRTRIHGEHGWDVHDLYGQSRKHQRLRRLYRPLVYRYISVSRHIEGYLINRISVPASKIVQIYNGVDTERFGPNTESARRFLPTAFAPADTIVIGTVGRMQPVKDQVTLVRAFLSLLETVPCARSKLRLVLVGDGPLRQQVTQLVKASAAEKQIWLAGERSDVAELLCAMSVFVLPSLAEGISNTILEAMATGLPVIATRVGGNAELVEDGKTGFLVPSADPKAMAQTIKHYIDNPSVLRAHGCAGRVRVEKYFSLKSMIDAYQSVYEAATYR